MDAVKVRRNEANAQAWAQPHAAGEGLGRAHGRAAEMGRPPAVCVFDFLQLVSSWTGGGGGELREGGEGAG